jgi:hypothetical protein
MKRTIFSLALLLSIPTSIFAQQPDCRHRTIPVNVVDDKDVPVAGLTAENFRGEFRGEPVRIVSADFGARPIRLVILLDLSGSMGAGEKHLVADILVSQILLSALNGSQVALITFSDKVQIRFGLRQDKQAVEDVLRELNLAELKSFKGQTALWDAVGEAVSLLNPSQPGDVVYAVSDGGGDNRSHKRASVVEKMLLDSSLRFFAFLVPYDEVYPRHSAEIGPGLEDLKALAQTAGGNAINLWPANLSGPETHYDLSPRGKKQISEAAGALYKQMQEFYFVEISLMKVVDKPRSWKLKLVPNGGRQIKGLSLHYPQRLFPCSGAKDTQTPTPK